MGKIATFLYYNIFLKILSIDLLEFSSYVHHNYHDGNSFAFLNFLREKNFLKGLPISIKNFNRKLKKNMIKLCNNAT